jgi:hypothetical protein
LTSDSTASLARDAERQRTQSKIACRGGFTPAINDEHVAATRRDLGLWLDTSEQSPDETVRKSWRDGPMRTGIGGSLVTRD